MKSFQYLAPIASFRYAAPRSTEELLELLDVYGPRARIIAGGTDLMIALKERHAKPEVVVDLSPLRQLLGGISLKEGSLIIGAMATYSDLERNPLVVRFARALGLAASQVGSLQIRNIGTLGGNLANASPAADAAPPLIALSAKVHLLSRHGERTVPAEDLFSGVKRTVLSSDELITSVEVPAAERISSYWMRFARRNENALSVVSVAASATIDGDVFGVGRISLGAVAPTPILARRSSSAIEGNRVDGASIEKIASLAREESSPISDVRASAEYRKHLVYLLTQRVLSKVAGVAN